MSRRVVGQAASQADSLTFAGHRPAPPGSWSSECIKHTQEGITISLALRSLLQESSRGEVCKSGEHLQSGKDLADRLDIHFLANTGTRRAARYSRHLRAVGGINPVGGAAHPI